MKHLKTREDINRNTGDHRGYFCGDANGVFEAAGRVYSITDMNGVSGDDSRVYSITDMNGEKSQPAEKR